MTLLAKMISERESNFTRFYDRSGSKLADRYSLSSSLSPSCSPPWSPYCSPETKFQAAIPFSWEDRPGVSKYHKSPAPHGCFHEDPRRPPSEFSVVEAFQGERRPHRWSKKRVDDDPFLLALVECTKQAAAMSMSKDGRQGHGKQGRGSSYSCRNSCDVDVDAQIAIPPHTTQLSRQKNKNKNKNNERKIRKSYPGYKFDEDYACVALLNGESQRQTSSYYADSRNISAHKNVKAHKNVRFSSGYKLLLSTVGFLFTKQSSQSSHVIYRA
uniref:Uncharacterized protein n=1 Tax=Picea sitchensis TaxID=3332 RepID=B8LPD5_PICSI|nr:unknown [Picea sitchensis]